MNQRQKKKRDKRLLENGDLSYCRRCGNENIWHIFNNDWTVAAMFCTRCGWKCGKVKTETVERARADERRIIDDKEKYGIH